MDINKVWLSGVVITQPTYEQIGESTPFLCFRLKIQERYHNKRREEQFHENIIKIECLGKLATKVSTDVQKGSRYMIDGYLRYNRVGVREDLRVRAFAVYPDESLSAKNYSMGLSAALAILDESLDIDAAKEKINTLLSNS